MSVKRRCPKRKVSRVFKSSKGESRKREGGTPARLTGGDVWGGRLMVVQGDRVRGLLRVRERELGDIEAVASLQA